MQTVRYLAAASLLVFACGPLDLTVGDDPAAGSQDEPGAGGPDAGVNDSGTATTADSGTNTDAGSSTGTTAESADRMRAELLATLPQPDLTADYVYAGDPRPAFARTPLTDSMDNTPAGNPITNAGATLGRVLFYDRLLSFNGRAACASCHAQADGFSDRRRLSEGFDGGLTGRNSMPLINLRYYGGGQRAGAMFWDHRSASLEEQVLMPIQDQVEMGLTLDELVLRVSSASYYPSLFEDAFGSPTVDADRISRALAQFVRSIAAFDSRWDRAVAQGTPINQDFASFSEQENEGKRLFFGPGPGGPPGPPRPSCAVCHLPGGPDNAALFFVDGPKNNGLPDDQDTGFGAVTGRVTDDRRFKSPSLRNVVQTAPYMHDGRFASLEDVVRFYSNGIGQDPNLDRTLRDPEGRPVRFNFSPTQQQAMIAFLRTLTDENVAVDPRFSNPFPALP